MDRSSSNVDIFISTFEDEEAANSSLYSRSSSFVSALEELDRDSPVNVPQGTSSPGGKSAESPGVGQSGRSSNVPAAAAKPAQSSKKVDKEKEFLQVSAVATLSGRRARSVSNVPTELAVSPDAEALRFRELTVDKKRELWAAGGKHNLVATEKLQTLPTPPPAIAKPEPHKIKQEKADGRESSNSGDMKSKVVWFDQKVLSLTRALEISESENNMLKTENFWLVSEVHYLRMELNSLKRHQEETKSLKPVPLGQLFCEDCMESCQGQDIQTALESIRTALKTASISLTTDEEVEEEDASENQEADEAKTDETGNSKISDSPAAQSDQKPTVPIVNVSLEITPSSKPGSPLLAKVDVKQSTTNVPLFPPRTVSLTPSGQPQTPAITTGADSTKTINPPVVTATSPVLDKGPKGSPQIPDGSNPNETDKNPDPAITETKAESTTSTTSTRNFARCILCCIKEQTDQLADERSQVDELVKELMSQQKKSEATETSLKDKLQALKTSHTQALHAAQALQKQQLETMQKSFKDQMEAAQKSFKEHTATRQTLLEREVQTRQQAEAMLNEASANLVQKDATVQNLTATLSALNIKLQEYEKAVLLLKKEIAVRDEYLQNFSGQVNEAEVSFGNGMQILAAAVQEVEETIAIVKGEVVALAEHVASIHRDIASYGDASRALNSAIKELSEHLAAVEGIGHLEDTIHEEQSKMKNYVAKCEAEIKNLKEKIDELSHNNKMLVAQQNLMAFENLKISDHGQKWPSVAVEVKTELESVRAQADELRKLLSETQGLNGKLSHYVKILESGDDTEGDALAAGPEGKLLGNDTRPSNSEQTLHEGQSSFSESIKDGKSQMEEISTYNNASRTNSRDDVNVSSSERMITKLKRKLEKELHSLATEINLRNVQSRQNSQIVRVAVVEAAPAVCNMPLTTTDLTASPLSGSDCGDVNAKLPEKLTEIAKILEIQLNEFTGAALVDEILERCRSNVNQLHKLQNYIDELESFTEEVLAKRVGH
ncbi:hypothetical protein HDU76_007751 [Blyttiomyces sp. JEL0837]|nr:hypothetical protein HDU76_007751 [Blyttiomyces sp. JEL0837]